MKKNLLLILVVMLISAHNAGLILKYENKIIGAIEYLIKGDSCKCDSTAVIVDTSLVYGLDVSQSQWQEVDLINTVPDSIKFIIFKATEGVTFVDSEYVKFSTMIDSTRFMRGFYHFYRVKDDPITQANWYLDTVKYFSKTALPPILDLEYHKNEDRALWTKDVMDGVLKYLEKIEEATKRRPIIYANTDFIMHQLTDTAFAKYPLWIANGSNSEPTVLPGAWKGGRWSFWQKADKFMIDNTKNDFDVFNGNLDSLKAFISSTIIN